MGELTGTSRLKTDILSPRGSESGICSRLLPSGLRSIGQVWVMVSSFEDFIAKTKKHRNWLLRNFQTKHKYIRGLKQ